MSLYKLHDNQLSPIKSSTFKLERDLQQLVESNIQSLFGLDFVASEFAFNNLRLDSVAYDPENNCFVVVEYKRDKSSSVVDQGYAYLSLVLNNQAEFVLAYNQKTKTARSKADFDWSATRIIFIASRFTPHQLEAINFKDLPFELWEVQLYEDNLLRIEQKIATKQAISVTTISRRGTKLTDEQSIVEKEIKTFTIDDVFSPSKVDVRSLFDELDERIKSLDDSIIHNPRKLYVSYRNNSDWRNFIYISPYKHGIRIDITRTRPEDLQDPDARVTYDETSFKYKNQHVSQILVKSGDDIDTIMPLLQQIYRRHTTEYGK